MDLNLWRSIIDQAHDLNFETINLNGNFGDAGMHPDLLKMANHLFASSDMKLQISTNGSLRTKQFWKELAQSGTNRLQVIFCVDGLKDTHAIYRRKTNFDKIIDNIKAFTPAGGNAIMVTTLFDHNLHQIKELAKLAKDIGCMEYRTRKSYSFTDYNSLDDVVVSTNNIKDEDAYVTKYKSVYAGDQSIEHTINLNAHGTIKNMYKLILMGKYGIVVMQVKQDMVKINKIIYILMHKNFSIVNLI